MEETYTMFQPATSAGEILEPPETEPAPEPLKITRKHFSRLGLFFFLGAIITYVVQIVPLVLISYFKPELTRNPNISLIITGLPQYLIGMPALIALARRLPAGQIEKHEMKGGHFVIAAMMAFSIMYVSNLIGIGMTTVIGFFKGGQVENAIVDLVGSLSIPLMFFFMVICAPLIEEYVFRKLIVDRTVRYGQGVAVILSGLMFGLFHGNLNQFVYAFPLGMFLAFLYVKTGNLKITIALHAIVNFMGSILATLMMDLVDPDGYLAILAGKINYDASYITYMRDNALGFLIYMTYVFSLLGVVLAGGVLVIIALARSQFRFAPGEVVIPKGKRFTTVILNVGMLIYCIFWGAMIVYQLII